MKDFLLFRRMLIPFVIQLLFWLGTIVCIFVAIYGLFHQQLLVGISVLILGPLLLRLVCEYVMVLFRINATLTEIRQEMMVKNTAA